jgi:hypothetical protein
MENLPEQPYAEPKSTAKKSISAVGTFFLFLLCVGGGILITKAGFDFITPRFIPRASASAAPVVIPPQPISVPAPIETPEPVIAQSPAQMETLGRASAQSPALVETPAPASVQTSNTAQLPTNLLPRLTIKKKAKPAADLFVLNGLYIAGKATCALINNKMVEVGDQIDGAEVVRITSEGVQLNHNDQIIYLKSRD